MYIKAAPTAGLNVTITNNYALWVDAGLCRFDGDVSLTDTNLIFGTTTGTKLGTATTQKLSFWNATPVVQGAAIADAAGGAVQDAEARTALNTLLARTRTYGFIAT